MEEPNKEVQEKDDNKDEYDDIVAETLNHNDD